MTLGGGLILFLFVAFILSIPISIYMSFKQTNREWDEEEKRAKAWLEEELKKPRSSIEFITLDDQVHTTGPHEPYITHPGSRWGLQTTSESFANSCLRNAYERGYFMDEARNSYPTCNIKSAKVVSV